MELTLSLKYLYKHLWQSIVFWTFAMTLFAIFRYYGLGEEEGISTGPEHQGSRILPIFALFGFFIGIISALIEFFLDKYLSKRISIGLNLFINMLIYLIFIIILSTITIEISNTIYGLKIDNAVGWWRKDKTFWTVIIYMNIAALGFSFIQIALTIGFFIALGLIIAGTLFGFDLGLWFSVGKVVLASGSILYQT